MTGQKKNIMRISSILLLLLLTSLFACKNNKDNTKLLLEIPDTSKTHYPDIYYEVNKRAVDQLSLNKLENGVDTFELRLWAKVEVTNGGQVFVIRKIDNQWTCTHYYYIESEGKFNSNIFTQITNFTIDTFWVKKEKPKTSWDSFFKAVEKENIYGLPIQSDIKGFKPIVDDGFTYCIEFATKSKYKFYWYNCPDVYEGEFKECKQMTNILDIFNKEFGLTLGLEKFGEHPYRCKCKK